MLLILLTSVLHPDFTLRFRQCTVTSPRLFSFLPKECLTAGIAD